MIFLLTFVHIVCCFFLILVVLLQTGKGADVAAAFGGVSQTAFGARGGATLLSKLTTGSAIVFMLTSLILAVISTGPSSSVIDQAAPAGQTAPAGQVPATPAGAPPAPPPAVPGASEQAPPDQGTPPPQTGPSGTPSEPTGSSPGGF